MHNSPEKNLRFKIQFATTNLRWLAGETPRNETKIAEIKSEIAQWEIELAAMPKAFA